MMLTDIAVFSYGLSAVAFLVLAVLLLTHWRGHWHSLLLSFVCAISVLWSVATAFSVFYDGAYLYWADSLEVIRSCAWILFLLIVMGVFSQKNEKVSFWIFGILIYCAIVLGLTFYINVAQVPNTDRFGFLVSIDARTVLVVIGLILAEEFFRSAKDHSRWGVKYISLAIGGMFAYDFYLYSDAMMFKHMSSEVWTARGIVDALVVPLIAISAARNPTWSLGIALSRHLLMRSTTFVVVVLYLSFVAAAGYILRLFGGNWSNVLFMVLLFFALIMLLVLASSGTARAWLRVTVSKHFFSYRYDYREEWMRFTHMLSEGENALSERVIQAIASLVESPSGSLWIKKGMTGCIQVATWNMPVCHAVEPIDGDLCSFLLRKRWVVDLEELRSSPEKYDDLVMPAWLQDIQRAWLIVPLIHQGALLGFVLLGEARSKVQLNWEVCDLLDVVGVQAASYLVQQQSANALMVARQFESFNRMSTFVVHDLKNLVAQLSLLLANAEKHKDNPEFQRDMLETLDLSVNKMRRMLEKLGTGLEQDTIGVLRLDKLLQRVVSAKALQEPVPSLKVPHESLEVRANSVSLERVLGHLVQNAVEATPKTGQVSVVLRQQDRFAVIEIQDTGHGMSEDFIRHKLFAPFESTKTAGMGIGVFESQEYVHELGGKIEVLSTPGLGTLFRVFLPLYNRDEPLGDAQ